jgi:membrane associated rhomboid family serine protease
MSTSVPARKYETQLQGLMVLGGTVALMWIVQVIDALDSYQLETDGIRPHNIGHLWAILTAPFIHGSWQHLISNTIPFVFMGVIIAMRGAIRMAMVTLIVIVIGGFGTWLISPSNELVFGASGVVFGYATYLLTRGLFNRSVIEILVGAIVGAVWGAALLSSLVPHQGISWQGHLCGGIAGVLAAWLLSNDRPAGAGGPGHNESAIDRLLSR